VGDVCVDVFAGTDGLSLVSLPVDQSVCVWALADNESKEAGTNGLSVPSLAMIEPVTVGAAEESCGVAVSKCNVPPAVPLETISVGKGIGILEAAAVALRWKVIASSWFEAGIQGGANPHVGVYVTTVVEKDPAI
jgi:hypothetical protein